MCGIAGYTHYQHKVDAARIRRATFALTHRGPDQQGFYESDCVSLGAVRLRIIDLAGGDQPLKSEDGDTVLAFNGEIYNNTELREELRGRGHSFRTLCDTETVLHAFLEWDTECFSRLRGMFALAIWNNSERRLVLARDRIGIKPLYIYRHGVDLYFGSELKALFVHPEVERRIDPLGLHYFTSLNYVPSPHTLVEGIEKLPPGHWLEWRQGRTISSPYWSLSFHPARHYTLDSAAEELDSRRHRRPPDPLFGERRGPPARHPARARGGARLDGPAPDHPSGAHRLSALPLRRAARRRPRLRGGGRPGRALRPRRGGDGSRRLRRPAWRSRRRYPLPMGCPARDATFPAAAARSCVRRLRRSGILPAKELTTCP